MRKYIARIASLMLVAILAISFLPALPVAATTITVGPGATYRTVWGGVDGYTVIEIGSPANASGTLTSFQIYAKTTLAGVVVGTFYGSGTSYTCRASATIGAVTSGSVQTFTVSLAVQTGDYIGAYVASGQLCGDSSGSGIYYATGSNFGAAHTYTLGSGYQQSIYATGSTGGGLTAPTVTIGAATSGRTRWRNNTCPHCSTCTCSFTTWP